MTIMANTYVYLLQARLYPLHLLTNFILKKNKTHKEDITIIFQSERNWGTERFSIWYKLVNSRARIQTQAAWM